MQSLLRDIHVPDAGLYKIMIAHVCNFLQFVISICHVHVELSSLEVAVLESVAPARGVEEAARHLHQAVAQQESQDEQAPGVGGSG